MIAVAAAVLILVLGAAEPAPAQETVHFPSNDADLIGGTPTTLSGVLFRPSGDGPFAAVVLLHGCGGLHDGKGRLVPRHDDWVRRLRDHGWVALLVDSFGPRGVREICTAKTRPVEPGRERARDAYGALVYLQKQHFVRADRIALLGWSNGGSTVLWTIGTDSHVGHADPAPDAGRREGRLDAGYPVRRSRPRARSTPARRSRSSPIRAPSTTSTRRTCPCACARTSPARRAAPPPSAPIRWPAPTPSSACRPTWPRVWRPDDTMPPAAIPRA